MQEELKRYNTIGDIEGIAFFSKTVLSVNRIQASSLQKLCAIQNHIRLNCNAAVAFFEYLGLIKKNNLFIEATEKGIEVGKFITLPEKLGYSLCYCCFEKIIEDEYIDIDAVHFNHIQDEYYIEKYGFSVSVAIFRNILLQYNALSEKSGYLFINKIYLDLFEKKQKTFIVKRTLDKLKAQMEKQELQGERAELFVLNYEKERLISSVLKNRVQRISTVDVSAGYDIVSFLGDQSDNYDRFLEVKSYIGDVHFYWSANEIETAKLLGEKYFIVLVDDSKINVLNYEPIYISNPVEKIISSDKWIMNPTSFRVFPTGKEI